LTPRPENAIDKTSPAIATTVPRPNSACEIFSPIANSEFSATPKIASRRDFGGPEKFFLKKNLCEKKKILKFKKVIFKK